MNFDELVAELAALEQHLDNRVEIWHVIIDEHGQPTGKRIYRGSFQAPPDWTPPTFDQLMAKGRSD